MYSSDLLSILFVFYVTEIVMKQCIHISLNTTTEIMPNTNNHLITCAQLMYTESLL